MMEQTFKKFVSGMIQVPFWPIGQVALVAYCGLWLLTPKVGKNKWLQTQSPKSTLNIKFTIINKLGSRSLSGKLNSSSRQGSTHSVNWSQARNSKGIVGMAKWQTMPRFGWFWPIVAGSMAKSDRIYGQMK